MFFGDHQRKAARQLIHLALAEDLNLGGDETSMALIPADQVGSVQIVAREPGVLAGLPAAWLVFDEIDHGISFRPLAEDGDSLAAGQVVAELAGKVRSLLAGERTSLNFLTHLSGVATLTRRYVESVAGTKAKIYDTRKTLPGWRALQKYAVLAGGGYNHRQGLFDMVLIKDNHLAAWRALATDRSIAAAIRVAEERSSAGIVIEVEVDTL